jgi:hypothetical protein
VKNCAEFDLSAAGTPGHEDCNRVSRSLQGGNAALQRPKSVTSDEFQVTSPATNQN